MYEPEEHVAIQAANPKPLTSSQTVARFDVAAEQLEPEFGFKDKHLPLNGGLFAVAGGRGSGKTAFVDLIANVYEDRAFCDDKNSFV